MKSVLISVRPQWCEKIAKGEKALEVRKNRPKIDTPFKCYIYCTKGNRAETYYYSNALMVPYKYIDDHSHNMGDQPANGKIIGEFICDYIKCFDVPYPAFQNKLDPRILVDSCCTYYMLHRYAYHDDLYGWHISGLVIYDKPKELSEFSKPRVDVTGLIYSMQITRPPQSWCYVEDNAELLVGDS